MRASRSFLAGVMICLLMNATSSTGSNYPASNSVVSGYANVRDGKLFYEIAGTGHWLVLIHGAQLDSRMWDDQFFEFAERYRVLRYDVRRFGKSSDAIQPYSDEDDLHEILTQLGVRETYVLGLSMGGRIAIDYTLVHPEMVDGLICAGASLDGFQGSPDDNFPAVLAAARSGEADRATDLWLKDRIFAGVRNHPGVALRVRQIARENIRGWLSTISSSRMDPPALERLPEIRTPTLVLVGDRDILNIHEIAGILCARIPGAQLKVITGASHIVNMEAPSTFNTIVLGFLNRLRSVAAPR